MSSYSTLLESYHENERLENISFEEMGNMMQSLTEFVNEEIELKLEFTIQEAEEVADGNNELKEEKTKQATNGLISRLITKLKDFIRKIADAVQAFLAKARMYIKTGGNKALGKLLKNNGAVVKRDIKLKNANSTDIKKLYHDAHLAIMDVKGAIPTTLADLGSDVPDVPESTQKVIDAFKQNFAKSDVVTEEDVKKGTPVKDAYSKYVENWMTCVKTGMQECETSRKEGEASAKMAIKTLKLGDDKDVNAGAISAVSKLSSAMMQVCTASVRFSSQILSIAMSNSAKLALAGIGKKPE